MFDAQSRIRALDDAHSRAANANRGRATELREPRSGWAKLKNWFVETPAQTEARLAGEQLVTLQEEAGKAAQEWVDTEVQAQLQSQAAGAGEALAKQLALQRASARQEKLSGLAQKAERTLQALDEAAEQCSSAHSMEMMDAFSSNKGIALMSTMSTSDAGSKIREAREQVAALSQAVKSSGLAPNTSDAPDDMIDLMFDLAVDLPLDIFSFFNMSALSSSESSCRDAWAQIQPLARRLDALAGKAQEQQDKAQGAFDQARAPFVRGAVQSLPAALVELLPADYRAA